MHSLRSLRHAHHLLIILMALVLLLVFPAVLSAQDTPAEDGAQPPTPQTEAGAFSPQYAAASPETPEQSLGDMFNSTLGAINGVAFKYLLFDLSFGSLKYETTDADGNPVYAQDPVTEELASATQVQLIDGDGDLVFSARGEPVLIEMPAGSTVQRLTAEGALETTRGDVQKEGPAMPFLVVFLGLGAVFFTLWHRGIVFAGFKHSVDVVRGKFTSKKRPGRHPSVPRADQCAVRDGRAGQHRRRRDRDGHRRAGRACSG